MNALSILDMHRLVEQDVQKFGFNVYNDFDSEQVDLQLNRQISYLVEGILDKHFGRQLKVNEEQGFQSNQVSLDNLRLQHVIDETQSLSDITDGVKFTLPSAYAHHVRTTVTVSYTCIENKKVITKTQDVDVRLAQSQFGMKNHPFHQTDKDSPLAELVGNTIQIYKNTDFNITAAKLSYIKKPVVVKFGKDISGNYDPNTSVNCDLDPSLHYMVVDMTSIRIMKILESNPQKIINIQQEIT